MVEGMAAPIPPTRSMVWEIIAVVLSAKWQLPVSQLSAEDLSWVGGQAVLAVPTPSPLLTKEELSRAAGKESPCFLHRPVSWQAIPVDLQVAAPILPSSWCRKAILGLGQRSSQ